MRFLLGVLLGYSMRGKKETFNHSAYNHSVHCLHSRANHRTLGAPVGCTTRATDETNSNPGSGAQRIEL